VDERADPNTALIREVTLAVLDETTGQPAASVAGIDSKAVHVPPPPVERRDDASNDRVVRLGDEERAARSHLVQ
jgi:hypothetical protein